MCNWHSQKLTEQDIIAFKKPIFKTKQTDKDEMMKAQTRLCPPVKGGGGKKKGNKTVW